MINIYDIYFIKTEHKSPYTYEIESVFDTLEPSTTENLKIDSLILNEDEALHLDCQLKGYLDFDISSDYEESLPQVATLANTNYVGTPIFNYRFALTLGNNDVEFTSDFRNLLHYLVSNTWQIVFQSDNNWFICYAEFGAVNTKITNDAIQSILFESKNAKENIFVIDEFGTIPPIPPNPTVWTQVAGQYDGYTTIIDLLIFNDKLYGLGYKNTGGQKYVNILLEYDVANEIWIEKAPPTTIWGESITGTKLIEWDGDLYCLESLSNYGLVWKWNGSNTWSSVAMPPGNYLGTALVFNTIFYFIQKGKLYSWNGLGLHTYTQITPTLNGEEYMRDMLAHNDVIYAGTGNNLGCLYGWETGDTVWTEKAGQFGSETSVSELAELNGKIYGGSYPSGLLLEHTPGTPGWTQVAGQIGSNVLMRLTVWDGKIYGGGATDGKLYVWNSTNAWVEVLDQLGSETITTMLTDGNDIYAGTSALGKLYKW